MYISNYFKLKSLKIISSNEVVYTTTSILTILAQELRGTGIVLVRSSGFKGLNKINMFYQEFLINQDVSQPCNITKMSIWDPPYLTRLMVSAGKVQSQGR